MTTKIVYRCEFDFKGAQRTVRSDRGIETFKDGFWVDDHFRLTTGSDCRFWVPPHCILYIARDIVVI